MHDVATAAVENKSAGTALDAGVADKVGAHLGADFSGVRVHRDPLAHEASAAIGARAFAHGRDVFLGANEAPNDLGLMAHELTHVAQQGGARQHGVQRKVNVGEANSPAEQQADAVAGAVTGGGPPASLLVDGGTPTSGQILKSRFIAQLRESLAAVGTPDTLPAYAAIEAFFVGYADRPAQQLESLVRRFAPATQGARDATAMIAAIMTRLAAGVQQWRTSGLPPPEVLLLVPDAAARPAGPADATGPVAARSLRAPDGRETLGSLEATLGAGAPVDRAMARQVSDVTGVDVGGARIHTGPLAAAKATEAGAVAFAAGKHIVMGAGAPSAGSLEGDALLAHELVHTAQQADAARDPAARRKPLGDESAAAEDVADHGAVSVLAGQRGGASRAARGLLDLAKTDVQLQRCEKTPSHHVTPANGTFAAVAPAVRAAATPAAREAALVTGITGANQRLTDLKSLASTGGEPIATLRRTIITETGVGGPGRALDLNPYVTLRSSNVEAVWRAWAENPAGSLEPWTLLAIWMKEGLSAPEASNSITANDASNARSIYRSEVYYQNMGADHYIHFVVTAGDNQIDRAPGSGAAHDAAFHAGIAAQVAAGRLPRDIGPEIDAQLTVAAAPGGGFTVTATPRFQQLSLMLVDAFFRENRSAVTGDLAAHGASAAGDDLDAMAYMRWNMGATRLNPMLGRSMAGNRDPDGSTPSLPTWALHRQVRAGEYDGPRANAIRFQYYQRAYRYIFEAGY